MQLTRETLLDSVIYNKPNKRLKIRVKCVVFGKTMYFWGGKKKGIPPRREFNFVEQ